MAGHQHRVSCLARGHRPGDEPALGKDRGGSGFAGIIHDIGKIAVPAEIMTKLCRLTKSEFQLVKEHPGSATR